MTIFECCKLLFRKLTNRMKPILYPPALCRPRIFEVVLCPLMDAVPENIEPKHLSAQIRIKGRRISSIKYSILPSYYANQSDT